MRHYVKMFQFSFSAYSIDQCLAVDEVITAVAIMHLCVLTMQFFINTNNLVVYIHNYLKLLQV